MSQGGEPGHDDYGLPRVDVEIPDDARELDRDVQAYHRELRALRRHQRSRKWRAPLQRSGVLLPLIAGCLLIAMLSGMVLTMFTANSYISGLTSGQPGSSRIGTRGSNGAPTSSISSRSLAIPPTNGPTSSGRAGRTSVLLPNRTITVGGKTVELRTLTSVALAIIPATCRCAVALRQLLAQAKTAGVAVYLIGSRASRPAMVSLLATARHGTAIVATGGEHVLAAAYHPVGLTVLLVDHQGAVTVAPRLLPGLHLAKQLASLTGSAP